MPRSYGSDVSSSLESTFFSEHPRRTSDAASSANTDWGSLSDILPHSKETLSNTSHFINQSPLTGRSRSNTAFERLSQERSSSNTPLAIMFAQYSNPMASESQTHQSPQGSWNDLQHLQQRSLSQQEEKSSFPVHGNPMSRENSQLSLGTSDNTLALSNDIWDMNMFASPNNNPTSSVLDNNGHMHMMDGMMFNDSDMDHSLLNTDTSQNNSNSSISTPPFPIYIGSNGFPESANTPTNNSNIQMDMSSSSYIQHLQALGAFTSKNSNTGSNSPSLASTDEKAMYMPTSSTLDTVAAAVAAAAVAAANNTQNAPVDSPGHNAAGFSRSRKPDTLSFGHTQNFVNFDGNSISSTADIDPADIDPANHVMFSPTFMDALNSAAGQTNVFEFANFDTGYMATAGNSNANLQPPHAIQSTVVSQHNRVAGHRRTSSAASSQPSIRHSHQNSIDSNTQPATPASTGPAGNHLSIFNLNQNQIMSNPPTIQPSAVTMVAPPESAYNPTPTFSELMSMERQASSSSNYSNGGLDDSNMSAAAAAFFGRNPTANSKQQHHSSSSPLQHHQNQHYQSPQHHRKRSMSHTDIRRDEHEPMSGIKLEPIDNLNLAMRSVTPNGGGTNSTAGATTPTIMEEDDETTMNQTNHFGVTMETYEGHGGGILERADLNHFQTFIRQYLSSNDPMSFGERTVILMTSKVAQKSYGTEKRFLCPPPTVIMLGHHWWQLNHHLPPRLSVSISGENAIQPGHLEWYNYNGEVVESDSSGNGNLVVSGKSVAKQLFINDADEKRKRVEVLVKVQLGNTRNSGNAALSERSSLGVNPMRELQTFGVFGSRGIKVISKPSKKRQSVKNMELCIHHGTAISLFNRIRSQTVSTKYLGVSSSTSAFSVFTSSNWVPPHQNLSSIGGGHGGQGINSASQNTFVARTNSWDPFIIWLVDTRLQSCPTDNEGKPPVANVGSSSIGCPPPPAVALRTKPNQGPIPIHYNQPILLQCLTTGLISPVMVIRKVDKGSMVLGMFGPLDGRCDETLGDPISQLHKVAFQIYQPDPTRHEEISDLGESGRYLACLGDIVGMQRAEGHRRWVQSPPSPPIPLSPSSPAIGGANGSFGIDGSMPPPPPPMSSPSSATSTPILAQAPNLNSILHAAEWATAQTNFSNSQARSALSPGAASAVGNDTVNRRRRVSSSVVVKSPSGGISKAATVAQVKNRRRGNSMSMIKSTGSSVDISELVTTKAKDSGGNRSNLPVWTEDVTDAAVWTIVGTDCAKYTFCIPPMDQANPALPVTPIPIVTECFPPSNLTQSSSSPHHLPSHHHFNKSINDISMTTGTDTMGHYPQAPMNHHVNASNSNMVTLYGESFTRDLTVWFGDIPSERTEFRNREVIAAVPPTIHVIRGRNVRLPILLVRADGVIYKTGKFYP